MSGRRALNQESLDLLTRMSKSAKGNNDDRAPHKATHSAAQSFRNFHLQRIVSGIQCEVARQVLSGADRVSPSAPLSP